MKKFFTIVIFLFSLSLLSAQVEASQIDKYVENPTEKGQTRLTYLMWDVYDATLYTSNGADIKNAPFALKLDYLMKLKGEDIAKKSIEEMRKQGFSDEKKLGEWLKFMSTTFPDVKKGTNITGIHDSKGQTIFYKDNVKIGQTDDKAFTKHFFDIWLGEKTSQPKLRKQLLGLK